MLRKHSMACIIQPATFMAGADSAQVGCAAAVVSEVRNVVMSVLITVPRTCRTPFIVCTVKGSGKHGRVFWNSPG